jgi:hypothetical protein
MSDSKNTSKQIQRDILPIPDQPYAGFVAYDAKDPDSKFAPIEVLRPPFTLSATTELRVKELWKAPLMKFFRLTVSKP